jgi:hypothetical protein
MHFYRSLPVGFQAVRSWSIYDLVDDWILYSSSKPGRQIAAYVLLILGIAGFMTWITIARSAFPMTSGIAYATLVLASLFITIAIHELCHALVIYYYGGHARFGAKWMKGLGPVIYVTAHGYFTVHAYRYVALAPLVIVSGVCFLTVVVGMGWWAIVPFVFNAIGAGGDILSLRVLKRYPSGYLIEDTQDGFTVYRSS